jgi:hypothetical protein
VIVVNDNDVILYLGGDPDADRAEEAVSELLEGLEGDTDADSADENPLSESDSKLEVCVASIRALVKTDC